MLLWAQITHTDKSFKKGVQKKAQRKEQRKKSKQNNA